MLDQVDRLNHRVEDVLREFHTMFEADLERAYRTRVDPRLNYEQALELADELSLTSEQRAATRALMDSHRADARAIGAQLVEAERELDRLFARGEADDATLADRVRTAAALRGEYRLSHVETHRRMRALLSPGQVRRYDQLRGYTAASDHRHRAPDHKHRQ